MLIQCYMFRRNYQEMGRILALTIVYSIMIHRSFAVTLEQTVPEHNAPVCPGELLSYTCTSTGGALAWIESGTSLLTFNNPKQINTTIQGIAFTFRLVDILPGSPATYVSTATITSVTSNEDDLLITCSDGTTFLSRSVFVAVQTEDCEGTVSCKVSPSSGNEMFSYISISLNGVPSDPMCVVGYIFSLGHESMFVMAGSSPSATFVISKEQGLTYENQKIYTLNAENQTGEEPCTFGITKPHQIKEIRDQQNCEMLTMTITLRLEWDVPSLTMDNCLSASELVWQYNISVTNVTSTIQFVTNVGSLDVVGLLPSSQYDITIIPAISDLGINGDPSTTNIVLSANCSHPESDTGITFAIAVFIPTCVLLIAIQSIITIVYFHYKRHKGKFYYGPAMNNPILAMSNPITETELTTVLPTAIHGTDDVGREEMEQYTIKEEIYVESSPLAKRCVEVDSEDDFNKGGDNLMQTEESQPSLHGRNTLEVPNTDTYTAHAPVKDPSQLITPAKVYEEALKRGEILVAYGHVALLGPPAVGKTSLKHGLKYEPLPDVPESAIFADDFSLSTSVNNYWKEVTDEDEMGEVAELIAIVYGKHIERPHGATEASTMSELLQVNEIEIDQISNLQVKSIFEEAKSRAKMIQSPTIKPDTCLHIWDSGGQPVFLDVLPAFLSSRTMFLLLFNASRSWSSNQKVLQYLPGRMRHIKSAEITTVDILQQWMMAIYCHITKRDDQCNLLPYPRIILVGTHGDKAKKVFVQEKLETSYTGEKLYSDIIALRPLIVNNTTAGKGMDEDPAFEMIRKEVSGITSDKLAVKTPVTWVLFRKVLQRINMKSMSISEVCKVAVACLIPEEALSSVLTFYHELGVVLFYSHISSLQDVVIINPKWLVSQLGKLLTLEYKTQYNPNGALWELFSQKGILVEPLYKAVWKGCGIDPDALVDLLIHFHLAARIPTTGQHSLPGKVKEFFVPCVLKHYKEKVSVHSVRPEFEAAPVYVMINNLDFFPPGIFTRLVPTLASTDHGKIYKVDFDQPVFRNRVTFSCQDSKSIKITLIEMTHAIRIEVIQYAPSYPQSLSFVCSKLLCTIEKCCKEVEHCLYGNARDPPFGERHQTAMVIKWNYALHCKSSNCSSHSSHYCHFTPSDSSLICTKGTRQTFTNQMCWLKSEVPRPATAQLDLGDPQQMNSAGIDFYPYDGYNEEPVMGDLMRWISPTVATYWKLIGIGLKLSDGMLEEIHKDHPVSHDALEMVFTAWQKTKCSPCTWTVVLKVLASQEVGHKRLADNIARKLIRTQPGVRAGLLSQRVFQHYFARVSTVIEYCPDKLANDLFRNKLISAEAMNVIMTTQGLLPTNKSSILMYHLQNSINRDNSDKMLKKLCSVMETHAQLRSLARKMTNRFEYLSLNGDSLSDDSSDDEQSWATLKGGRGGLLSQSVFQRYYARVSAAIECCPDELARELYSTKFISSDALNMILTTQGLSCSQKSSILMNHIQSRIASDSSDKELKKLCQVMRTHPQLKNLADKMTSRYEYISLNGDSPSDDSSEDEHFGATSKGEHGGLLSLQVFKQYFSDLFVAVESCPDGLTRELFSKKLISAETMNMILTTQGLSPTRKSFILMRHVENNIASDSTDKPLKKLCNVMKTHIQLKSLASKIIDTFEYLCLNGDSPSNYITVDKEFCAVVKESSDQRLLELLAVIESLKKQSFTLQFRLVKLIFTGTPRVGKSTLKKRIMKEITNLTDYNEVNPSTGLEKPCMVQVSLGDGEAEHSRLVMSHTSEESLQTWKNQDLNKQLSMLFDSISTKRVVHFEDKNSDKSLSLQVSKGEDDVTSSSPVKTIPASLSLPPASSSPSLFTDVGTIAQDINWRKAKKQLPLVEENTSVYIMDVGGQPEFHEILPFVLQGPALHLLFFNLSEDKESTDCLDRQFEVEYVSEKRISFAPYKSVYPVKDVLFQLLASFHGLYNLKIVGHRFANTGLNPSLHRSQAILIGTYKDKFIKGKDLSQQKLCLDRVNQKLIATFEGSQFYHENFLSTVLPELQCGGTTTIDGDKIYVAMDNMYGTKEEMDLFRIFLAKKIIEVAHPVELPCSVLLFHLLLRYKYEKKPGICTLEESKELAEKCQIPRADVAKVLKYLHITLGTVLYYEDVPSLKDTVFCDPNVLLSKINQLIAVCLTCDTTMKVPAKKSQQTGIIEPELLKHVWSSAQCQGPISNQQVINFLLHYKLMVKIESEKEVQKLFMPCLLQPKPDISTITTDVLKSLPISPLLIRFNGSVVPLGQFTSLIVQLCLKKWNSEKPWKPNIKDRYRNQITFMTGTLPYVTLTARIQFIEVSVEDNYKVSKEKLRIFCSRARQHIMEAIKETQTGHSFDYGFYCPGTFSLKQVPHYAKALSVEVMECCRGKECDKSSLPIPIPAQNSLWFWDHQVTSTKNLQTASFHKGSAEQTRAQHTIMPVTETPSLQISAGQHGAHGTPLLDVTNPNCPPHQPTMLPKTQPVSSISTSSHSLFQPSKDAPVYQHSQYHQTTDPQSYVTTHQFSYQSMV